MVQELANTLRISKSCCSSESRVPALQSLETQLELLVKSLQRAYTVDVPLSGSWGQCQATAAEGKQAVRSLLRPQEWSRSHRTPGS